MPPIRLAAPTSRDRSPYSVSLIDFILRFGTTAARREIISGFLNYRDALRGVRPLLRSRGVIPNREDYDLLITDTALGSFGFELEELHRGELLPSQSPVEAAIDQAKSILEATVETDEALANAVSGTDPRALGAVRTF